MVLSHRQRRVVCYATILIAVILRMSYRTVALPICCLVLLTTIVDPRSPPSPWRKDNQLENLVTAASGTEIDWDHISCVLDNGRTGPQCCSRWQKVLHPQTIKGAWTAEVSSHVVLLAASASMSGRSPCWGYDAAAPPPEIKGATGSAQP